MANSSEHRRYQIRFHDATSYVWKDTEYHDFPSSSVVRDVQSLLVSRQNQFANVWDGSNCHIATVQPKNHPLMKTVVYQASHQYRRTAPKGRK